MSVSAVSRVPQEHVLKTWPVVFDAVLTRVKSFEVRRDDRDFAVGDTLRLKEWGPVAGRHSGRSCRVLITYLLPGGQFGIERGFVCMSVRRLP